MVHPTVSLISVNGSIICPLIWFYPWLLSLPPASSLSADLLHIDEDLTTSPQHHCCCLVEVTIISPSYGDFLSPLCICPCRYSQLSVHHSIVPIKMKDHVTISPQTLQWYLDNKHLQNIIPSGFPVLLPLHLLPFSPLFSPFLAHWPCSFPPNWPGLVPQLPFSVGILFPQRATHPFSVCSKVPFSGRLPGPSTTCHSDSAFVYGIFYFIFLVFVNSNDL